MLCTAPLTIVILPFLPPSLPPSLPLSMLAEDYPQLHYISTSSEPGLLNDVRTILRQAAEKAAAAQADPSLPPSLPLSLPEAMSHALASRIRSVLALPPSLPPPLPSAILLDGWPRSMTDLKTLEDGGREGGEARSVYVDACVFLDSGEEKEDRELVLLREGLKEGGREGGRAWVIPNDGEVGEVYKKVKEVLAPVLAKGGLREGGKEGGKEVLQSESPAEAAGVAAAAATAKTKPASSSSLLPFGGLLLPPPLSLALLRAGISSPTPIQEEAFPQIMRGHHVLIHDETGSGKTLAFLLPLLLPLLPPPSPSDEKASAGTAPSSPSSSHSLPCQLMIVCPTRELAVQVGRVVSDLLEGEGEREDGKEGQVALLIEESGEGAPPLLPSLPAPVLVGTAKVLWSEMVKANGTSSQTRAGEREGWMRNLRALVIDEVDRCLSPLGQYATLKEKKQKGRHPKPAVLLVEEVMRRDGRGGGRDGGKVQFVGASATIGRPLRREVARCLGVDPKLDPPVVVRGGGREGRGGGVEEGRAVSVPKGIAHRYIAVPDEDVQEKLLAVRAYLIERQPRRPLLFVPQQQYVQTGGRGGEEGGRKEGGAAAGASVSEVVSRLGRLMRGTKWEGRVKALHEEMGFGGGGGGGGRTGGRAGKQVVDGRGGKKGRGMGGGGKAQVGGEEERERRRKVADLLSLEDQVAGPLASTSSSLPSSSSAMSFPLLVTSVETARGLDFAGECDCVLILGRAKSADEYQHVAGRTGRRGRDGGREVMEGEGGSAVSVISYVDIKKLTGYESMLGIKFTRENGMIFG